MRRRNDPRQIAKLVEVQRARRAAADAALAAARDGALQARAQEGVAREGASAAQDDWFAFLARTGFAPDYMRALAVRLVAREAIADQAAEQHRAAERAHLHCQEDWRLSEAQVKLTEASLDRARRDASRDREERRLGELSDRVSYAWVSR
ncbi:MAG: hypothetical protein WC729_11325 [Sphingomonas sp.]|uniref:hypothetical protein n=1 Tax=Sphingomonas sp. TaxID=28214 RepID=UPI003569B258